ncbi:Membrane proteins related to metalloendopeptidases [hydrothermal vent metagenome]|uniref:Membrane proteins related to metalloendopeptidases n=1 Tax=hydrothermal vent metagenome TaxID=652676 RepID=A0A1W1ECZ9_9ZZZZ
MKYILLLILMINFVFGAKVYHKSWEKGQTFSKYMQINNISAKFLDSISKEDQLFLLEVRDRYSYYELRNDAGVLLQALIPISVEMQIHIFKNKNSNEYGFDVIPIEYKSKEYYSKVIIQKNPYTDTLKTVKDENVAKKLSRVFRGDVDAKKLKKNDEISFVYKQRTRLGLLYANPEMIVAKVKRKDKSKFIYVDENGIGYKDTAKKIAYTVMGKKKVTYTRKVAATKKEATFGMPIRHIRITSSFAYKRWHPILHRYRPHHGVDFGAKRGTPIYAVNSGKVIYSGWMGGYGKVVKIKHNSGYVSLYAHQSRIRIKRGKYVKKGQLIGYVGSTGRSTGPHLHFGLMKNGRWINPMKVLRKKSIKTSVLKKFTKYEDVKITKYKAIDMKELKKEKARLMQYVDTNASTQVWDNDKNLTVHINDKEKFL